MKPEDEENPRAEDFHSGEGHYFPGFSMDVVTMLDVDARFKSAPAMLP